MYFDPVWPIPSLSLTFISLTLEEPCPCILHPLLWNAGLTTAIVGVFLTYMHYRHIIASLIFYTCSVNSIALSFNHWQQNLIILYTWNQEYKKMNSLKRPWIMWKDKNEMEKIPSKILTPDWVFFSQFIRFFVLKFIWLRLTHSPLPSESTTWVACLKHSILDVIGLKNLHRWILHSWKHTSTSSNVWKRQRNHWYPKKAGRKPKTK